MHELTKKRTTGQIKNMLNVQLKQYLNETLKTQDASDRSGS